MDFSTAPSLLIHLERNHGLTEDMKPSPPLLQSTPSTSAKVPPPVLIPRMDGRPPKVDDQNTRLIKRRLASAIVQPSIVVQTPKEKSVVSFKNHTLSTTLRE